MGLLNNLTPDKEPEPCRAVALALSLDKEDAQILLDAYKEPRWTAHGLSKALKERGLTIAPDTIRAHQRNQCKCLNT
jgi:hypothetical protein